MSEYLGRKREEERNFLKVKTGRYISIPLPNQLLNSTRYEVWKGNEKIFEDTDQISLWVENINSSSKPGGFQMTVRSMEENTKIYNHIQERFYFDLAFKANDRIVVCIIPQSSNIDTFDIYDKFKKDVSLTSRESYVFTNEIPFSCSLFYNNEQKLYKVRYTNGVSKTDIDFYSSELLNFLYYPRTPNVQTKAIALLNELNLDDGRLLREVNKIIEDIIIEIIWISNQFVQAALQRDEMQTVKNFILIKQHFSDIHNKIGSLDYPSISNLENAKQAYNQVKKIYEFQQGLHNSFQDIPINLFDYYVKICLIMLYIEKFIIKIANNKYK
jgi:hypothetical protein